MADDKYTKALYDQLSSKLELGDYNQFQQQLSSDDKFRKAIFNQGSTDLDLGDYPSFEGQVKKKPSSQDVLTSASGKEEIPFLGMSGKNPNASVEPSTPPSPLPSAEPVVEKPKETAKTVKDYIASFGAATGKGFAELSDLADNVMTMGMDAVNQVLLGRDAAVEFKKMREEGTLSPAFNPIRPFEALTQAINYTTQFSKPLPETTKKQRIVKGAVEGAAGIIPLALTSTLFPEIKAAQVLQNAGIQGLSKFGMILGSKEAVTKAVQAQEGTTEQKIASPFLGALEGYVTGQAFDALGTMSGKIGEKIAGRVIPNVTSTSQALTKGLVQQTGSGLADAVFFGTYGNIEEYLQTGQISAETFATNAGMGMLLRTKDLGKLMWAKGINTIIGADKDAINNAIKSNARAEDLAQQAQDKIDAVENGTSIDKEKDVVDAFTLAKASQMKAVADEVLTNPNEVKESVNESTLDKKAKEIAIDKIDEIVHDNDPRAQAIQEFNDKIGEIDDKLETIRGNKALSEVEKEAKSAPLKEKKLALKEEATTAYSNFKETFKLGNTEFKSKKELTDWLDKNYNEEDRFSSVNEEGYLEPNTMKVFNEWYEKNKKRLAEDDFSRREKEAEKRTIAQETNITFRGTMNGLDSYAVELPDGRMADFSTKEGTSKEEVATKRDQKLEEFQTKIEEEKQNAESNRTQNSDVNQQVAPGDEQGAEDVNDVRNNEQARINEQQKQEEVTPPKEETLEEKYQKSDFDKKWAATRDEAITKLTQQIKEAQKKSERVLSNVPKTSGKSVRVGNFGDNRMSVDAINKKRSQKALQEANKLYDDGVQKLRKIGLEWEQIDEITGNKEAAQSQENLPIQSTESTKPLQTDNNVESLPLVGETPQEQIPIENTANQPLSTPSEGNVPPPPESPLEKPKAKEKQPEREKALLNRMHNAEKLSKEFKKGVEEKGLTYEQVSNAQTAEDVDYLIADKGLDEAEKATFNTNNTIEPRVRALSATRLVKALDELAGQAETPAEEYAYRERSIAMADFIDNKARDWGRGIQILGSAEVNDMLAPKTQVIRMKKEVRRQRDAQIENNKEDIGKKKKDLEKVNKDVAGEVIGSKEYQDLKKRVEELEKKLREEPRTRPKAEKGIQDKIRKEQDYRKTQWDILKKPSDTAQVSVIGLSKEQIEAVGNIVASYVREGFYRTEDILTKLKKDWFKNTGQILSDEDARKLLPDKVEDKKLSEIEKEGTDRDNADKLVARIERMLQDPKIPKDDPIRQMIDTLFEKVKEKDTKEKKPVTKKSEIDKIREALENKDEYADVWNEAKEKVVQKINTNSELSEDQRSELNKRLQGFYEEVIGKPFSEKSVEGATKQGLKDIGLSIDKVIKDHYTVYDATKRTLQEKLVDELGLGEEQSKMLADAVGKQFDKIAIARKKSILKSGVTAKEVVKPKQAKQLHDKLIELTNLGAFSDAEFSEAYADKWGFPKLEPEQVREIERLAKMVQDAPEGYQKFERIQDLLAYTENIKGIDMGDVYMSMWYSSILSGYRTQAKNFVQNTITSLFEGAVSTIQNPLNTRALLKGLTTGWGEGLRQFGHIMETGYNPIKGYKVEVPSTQERFSFKGGNLNPANWGKYVTRLMVAADAFSYSGLKEMRSYEIAMNEARKLNKNATEPTKSTWATATELLNKTSERVAIAEQQTTDEGLKGVEHRRRVWELMEQGRTKEMVEDAAHFAAHGTFNYSPEGVLGMMTEAVSHATQDVAFGVKVPFTGKSMSVRPLKFIIPFTRIIANVTNMALDYYPPTGLFRWTTGSIGAKKFEENPRTKGFYHKYTAEEKAKVLTKAMIGVAAQIGMYMLTQPDDDGKSAIEITANGYGDFQKNYELKELGWQPYSIKIGDKWYSYQYTPLILALAPIGYMRDMQVYNKEKVKEENIVSQLGMAYFKGLQVITDMTWASSLNSLMQAFTSKDPAQAQSVMKNLTTSTAKGMIYPKLAEQITQVLDAAQKNPRHDAKDLIGKILRDIPIARNKYNIMLNAVGEPVLYDPLQMTANVKHDPFWEWLTDKNINIGKPDQKSVFYDDITKTERGMTNQEYYDFVKASGPEIKRRIEEEVIPENLIPADARKAVADIKSEVRQMTKTEMFGWGNLREQYPDDWKLLRDNGVLQVPHTSEILRIENKKVSLTKEQIEEFNTNAMNTYRQLIRRYIENGIGIDKADIGDPFTGESKFDVKIKALWRGSLAKAKGEMTKKLMPEDK